MLEKKSHIPELYDLKNRNNNEIHKHYDYDSDLLEKMFPPMILKNPTNYEFLSKMKELWLYMYESALYVKNFYNYTVPRNYDRHHS